VPNLRIYRSAWIVPAIVALLTLLFLRSPDVPSLSAQPTSFDAQRALSDARTLALRFPGRTPGSDADARSAVWLVERIRQLGLQPHIESFTASVDGHSVALQNVWAASPGKLQGAIVVLAGRDSPPRDTQGADDNASGVASVLELVRVFTLTTHAHPLVFLWTDGDAYGDLGASAFVARHSDLPMIAALALRRVGAIGTTKVSLDGWSASPRVAPPWTWILTSQSQRSVGGLSAPLPGAIVQVLRLAAPVGPGSQGPFVAAGVPATSVGSAGRRPPPQLDIASTLSAETLARMGRGSQAELMSIDTSTSPLSRSGATVFFSRFRTLAGRLVVLTLLALTLPLAAVTLDLFARARRRKAMLGPAWTHFGIRFAPWLALLVVAYAANLVGLLPGGRGTAVAPDSAIALHPRLLRVGVLVALAVLTYGYALLVDRRYVRRAPSSAEDVVLVAHVVLLGAALVMFLANPFSLLLILPAAILWPLARPGDWRRSLLPVFAGFTALAIELIVSAAQLHLGLAVWWYYLVLLENGTVPVPVAFAGAAFLAAALMLGRALHARRAAATPAAKQPPPPDEPVDRLGSGVAAITVTVKPPQRDDRD
jgi:hypothetical protein